MNRIAIIGGGPAGYVAAITAAQQGKEVTLVVDGPLGGTCLNEGCMPTKSLLESADTYELVKNAGELGICLTSNSIEIDWEVVQKRKKAIVSTLVQGVHYLMKKNKIKVIQGRASLITNHQLRIENDNKYEEIEASKITISTGSEPIPLPFAPFDGKWIIHSGQAMSLPSIPTSLLIIGGGVIGCEFASIYSRMGTKVTIVEMGEKLLPGEDEDISAVLHKELASQGVIIHASTSVNDMNTNNKKVFLDKGDGRIDEVHADYVLVSIGRKPRVNGMGLERNGIDFSKHGISVNNQMQTSNSSIYACGDVIGGIQLAHVAFHEGRVAALNACGHETKVNYRAIPRCIYTSPEIASVGLTETEARNKYGDIKVGEFPFSANGKAVISNKQIGKVKVVVDPQFNEILGFSIVGPHATEIIGQGTVMLHAEITTDIMEDLIAAHPTLSECIHEALLSVSGQAVHT
ncbi:dihydrolipoyl dehydrogenase [Peribacillus butanolivorans]|uniref:Dihydrolipoyl dehydrogenase n=1 Tax=Peribacillus butanolivorans TaxID=421767 RepID=A0ABN5N7H4_9BACI|nr:dihydrolipoyl dehydrogenase [Peribacillus butanolivorans]AXN41364.1 dihydrolipoyl dehydrogenase [Peribacillus butanolivorans]